MHAVVAVLLLAGASALQDTAEFEHRVPPPDPPAGQCYVCVSPKDTGTADYVRAHYNQSVEPCDQFKPGDARFIRTCQQPFLGCLTTIKGREITRQCSEDSWDKCHDLNGVRYCYCLGPLCNDRYQDAIRDLDSFSDDEDFPSFVEGSGNGSGADTDEYSSSPAQTTEREEKSVAFHVYPSLLFCIFSYTIAAIIL